jgi:Xaa-Pro dipeptidase
MRWSKQQIQLHTQAAKLLTKIVHESFSFINEHPKTTEYAVAVFIMQRYKHFGLVSDKDKPIVAFDKNTSIVHYFPKKKSRTIRKNSLILIDIWARMNIKHAPYADMTFMACLGKPSKEQENVFAVVCRSRDAALSFITKETRKNHFPVGKICDGMSRVVIEKAGYGKFFLHSTGHALGFVSPHARIGGLRKVSTTKLIDKMGYTIEPGIYLKNRFGCRSEIDFYILGKKVIVTTEIQKKIFSLSTLSKP